MSLMTFSSYEVIAIIGNKIKEVRKILKMTQLELSAGKIARNLISEIENGNTRLINKNAIEFIQQFLYFSLKKNIKINLEEIFYEFKSDSEIDKLKIIYSTCNQILNYRSNEDSHIDLELLDATANTILHNMLRYEMYTVIADIYSNNNDLDNYLDFKLKAIDILVLENKVDELYNQLNLIRPTMFKLKRNHAFITVSIMSISIFKRNNFDFKVDLYYFISICYLRMNLYNDSIKYIDLYLLEEKDKSLYSIGLLHKANIYSKSNSYTIARDLYSQASILLLHNDDYLNYSIAISNIIDLIVYSNSDKTNESIDSTKYYCGLLSNILGKLTIDNMKIRIQSKLALGLSYANDNLESKRIFDTLFATEIVNNDTSLLANILTDALELYNSIGKLKDLQVYIDRLLELYSLIEFDDYCEKVILKYIQLNLENPYARSTLNRFMDIKYSPK